MNKLVLFGAILKFQIRRVIVNKVFQAGTLQGEVASAKLTAADGRDAPCGSCRRCAVIKTRNTSAHMPAIAHAFCSIAPMRAMYTRGAAAAHSACKVADSDALIAASERGVGEVLTKLTAADERGRAAGVVSVGVAAGVRREDRSTGQKLA